MNRKKFVLTLSAFGIACFAYYYDYKFIKTKGEKDIKYLDDNNDLIAELCDNIIPSTDTPGAKETMGHKYVIYAIKHAKELDANNFINGLKEVQLYSNNKYNLPFTKLNKNQQHQVMVYFQEAGKNFSGNLGKVRNKLLGKPFFTILKETTSIGYCTSMIGATQALAYDEIPTRFTGCTDYKKGQKSWATK